MKRFMLFAGEQFYAAGGIRDFEAAFDLLSEATEQGENKIATGAAN